MPALSGEQQGFGLLARELVATIRRDALLDIRSAKFEAATNEIRHQLAGAGQRPTLVF